MPIQLTKPVTYPHPEIPWDKTLVAMAASPVVNPDNTIECAINITLTPYRVLPDGTIDQATDSKIQISHGAAFADAQGDPALAVALQAIMGAVQTYITAKGL